MVSFCLFVVPGSAEGEITQKQNDYTSAIFNCPHCQEQKEEHVARGRGEKRRSPGRREEDFYGVGVAFHLVVSSTESVWRMLGYPIFPFHSPHIINFDLQVKSGFCLR